MAKTKFAYALSVALALGGTFVSTNTYATVDGDAYPCDSELLTDADESCTANSLASFKAGLEKSNINYILTQAGIVVANDLSLNIAGKTIETTSNSAFDAITVQNGAKLTISGDGTFTKKGTSGNIFLVQGEGSTIQLDGGNYLVDAPNRDIYGVYLQAGGKIIVNAGATIDTTGSNGAAIGGNNTTGYMYAVVNGGVLRSKYQTVYMPQQVSLDIKGNSVLEGGIVARMGHITIDGGTISGIADASGLDAMADYYALGNGYPWVGDAIAVMGGTYTNNNDDHDNTLELTVNGGTLNAANGHAISLYDMGKVEQNMTVRVNGGVFGSDVYQAYVTDLTASPKAGYGVVQNNPTVVISGGVFNEEPNAEVIEEGSEAEHEDEGWVIYPTRVDYNGEFLEDGAEAEGHIGGAIDFNSELIADRKASLTITEVATDTLTVDTKKGGELVLAADIKVVDRNNQEVAVSNVSMKAYLDLTAEQYEALKEYDKVQVVYFDSEGAEVERVDAELKADGNAYWLEFNINHLSTYGVVGVNNAPSTPDTGTFTMVGASARVATIMMSAVVGMIVSGVTFRKLRHMRLYRRK